MSEFTCPRLLELRAQRGWSQRHLADVAGVSERTVQRAEAGEAVGVDTVAALAAAFDVDVDALSAVPLHMFDVDATALVALVGRCVVVAVDGFAKEDGAGVDEDAVADARAVVVKGVGTGDVEGLVGRLAGRGLRLVVRDLRGPGSALVLAVLVAPVGGTVSAVYRVA